MGRECKGLSFTPAVIRKCKGKENLLFIRAIKLIHKNESKKKFTRLIWTKL